MPKKEAKEPWHFIQLWSPKSGLNDTPGPATELIMFQLIIFPIVVVVAFVFILAEKFSIFIYTLEAQFTLSIKPLGQFSFI